MSMTPTALHEPASDQPPASDHEAPATLHAAAPAGTAPGARPGRHPALVALVVLALLALVDSSRLADELRFFQPPALIDARGGAPVLQDDASDPRLDVALQVAAAHLPGDAVCVIALDAWQRNYFRASYLLMPRRVWPVSETAPAIVNYHDHFSPSAIAAAARRRRATCLLAPAGTAIPIGWRRATDGALALFLPAARAAR